MIDASNYAPGTAYLAAKRYQVDDMKPYLYKTSDYGATWTPITNGIPATEFTRVVREDPERAGLLYAGTERGVWVSFDYGLNWQTLRRNLPIVPVHDLAIKEGDLIAATHGRSFWILDDLSALRQLHPDIARTPAVSRCGSLRSAGHQKRQPVTKYDRCSRWSSEPWCRSAAS